MRVFTFSTIVSWLILTIVSQWVGAQTSTKPQVFEETVVQPIGLRYVSFLPESEFPINQKFRVIDKNSKKVDQVNLVVDDCLPTEPENIRTIELTADYILGYGYTQRYVKFNALDFSTFYSHITTNPQSNLLALKTEYFYDKAKICWKSEQFEQFRLVNAPKRAIDHCSLFYLARNFDPEQLSEPAFLIVVYPQKNNTFITQVKFEGVKSVKSKDDAYLFSVNYGEFTEFYWVQKESPWYLLKATTEFEEWIAID